MFKLFGEGVRSFRDTRFLVIDMEMTGLNAAENAIVSAGSVAIEQGRIRLETAEHHYFLPTSLMGDDVSESAHIHMITDAQRDQHGEPLQSWLEDLAGRLKADAWVFHHATIDMAFLREGARRLGIRLPKVRICDTMKYELNKNRDRLPGNHAQLNLNSCRKRYGLPVYRQHHALSDALATAELWLAQNQSADA